MNRRFVVILVGSSCLVIPNEFCYEAYQFFNLILAGYLYLQLRKKKRVRTVGVREIFRRRTQFGDGHNLFEELRFRDPLFFLFTQG